MIAGGGQAAGNEQIELLLVEDDDGDALLVQDALEEVLPRAHIVRACTLEQAIAALSPAIDCALLDLGLPDASGLEAVARLRSRTPALPLIVLTGLADEATGVTAVQAGAQDYLLKGQVDGHQLARSIRYSIGRRQAEEAERELLLVEAQAHEVTRLERGLAPEPLLEDPSVWVASRYRAGRSRALLGGDFFDLVQTPDDYLHVLVGDVCGHGPDEAAIGVSLRAAWRALVVAGVRPEVILETLQQVFGHERHLPGLFATLCTLEIQPDRRSASIIRAGHPRPVLIHGTSISELSNGRGNAGIGVGVDTVALRAGEPAQDVDDPAVHRRDHRRAGWRWREASRRSGLHQLIAERIASRPNWRDHPWPYWTS